MPKGKIIINSQGVYKLQIANNVRINLDKFKEVNSTHVGMEIEYEEGMNSGGFQIATKIFLPKNDEDNMPTNFENSDQATAPYNFISLNNEIVTSEFKTIKDVPSFDIWQDDKINGYIEYEITNETDLFIGNEAEKTERTNKKIKELERNFFTIGKDGEKAISGSSFRGLIKNMISISSYSKLSQVEDKKLYWRNIINPDYKKFFLNETDSHDYLVKAGYLTKDENKYYILDAIIDDSQNQYYKVFGFAKDFNPKKNTTTFEIKDKNSEIKTFYEFNSSETREKILDYIDVWYNHSPKQLNMHRGHKVKYAIVNPKDRNEFSFKEVKGYQKGKLVLTGNFADKKHFHWLVNLPNLESDKIVLSEIEINSYKNDENLDERANLIKRTLENKPIPCFYFKDEKGNIRFGHTPIFRIPYEKSIAEHLPENHNNFNQLDITEALFGMIGKTGTEIFASRLHFMDAVRISKPTDSEYNQFIQPKILASPKPTAYKMYLKKGNDWNSTDNIRGFKLYHHKNANWQEQDKKLFDLPTDSHPPRIKPIKEGNTFKGRIYFDNLSEIELGALLFVLKLKDDLCLKIGMGKPYGMGSIKIDNVQLTTIERKERYKTLFSNKNTQFNLSEAIQTDDKINTLIKDFEDHILTSIKINDTSLWNEDRMSKLELMLNLKNKDLPNWNDKTRYLTLDREDKARWKKPLPYILDIVKK